MQQNHRSGYFRILAMIEKRRYQRIDVALPVILRHRGRLIPATALNLSCGGMFIRSEGSAELTDTSVEVIFDLGEGNRDLSLRGQIVHAANGDDASDAGIRFTNLFSLSHKAIQEYIRKNNN